MFINKNKNIVKKGILPALISGIFLFSCNGVHNEPPAEVIRMSGAGTSAGAGEERGVTGLVGESETVPEGEEQLTTERERRPMILDSTGNPIYLE